MRNGLALLCVAILMPLTAFGKTPIGDWQTVQQDIPRGWQITVVTSFTFPCIFQQATGEDLVCRSIHTIARTLNPARFMYAAAASARYEWNGVKALTCWPAQPEVEAWEQF